MTEDETPKKSLLKIKGQKVTQSDYRAVIALSLLVMFGYSLFANNEIAAIVLGPFLGVVVGYYFHDKALLKATREEI